MKRPIRKRAVEHTIRNDPRQRKLPLDPYKDIKARIVDVADIEKPMRVALYGRAGSGKTTLACTFPAPLLIDLKDEGTDSVTDVEGLKVLPATTWQDIEDLYWYLEAGDHPFKTVILDTVTQMQDFAMREVLSRKKKKVGDDAGDWGTITRQEWGDIAGMTKVWIQHMRDLPINVVFIAQDRIFGSGEEDTSDDQIQPEVGPRLSPSVMSALNASVDLLINCFIRENVIRKRVNGKIIETRRPQYALRVGPHARYITKIRKPRSVVIPQYLTDATYEDLMELVKGE